MIVLDLAALSRIATCWLALVLVGCSEPPPPAEPGPTPRTDDPELTHSWQMSADKSVLWSADLGSKPPELADALMTGGAPGIAHRSATACAQQGSLTGTPSVAVRLTIAEGGKVTAVEGDPAGTAATCIADAVRAELAKLDAVPAGAALMVMRFHAATPR
jgi:hypothetical protein